MKFLLLLFIWALFQLRTVMSVSKVAPAQRSQETKEFVGGAYGPEQLLTLKNDPVILIIRQLSDKIAFQIQQKGKGEPLSRISALSYRLLEAEGDPNKNYLIKIQVSPKPEVWWLKIFDRPLQIKGLDGPHPVDLALADFSTI